MPRFAYVARDTNGMERNGILDGPTADQIVDELHRQGLVVVRVAQEERAAEKGGAFGFLSKELFPSGVGVRDLALFTRQLATMISVGLPWVRGLRGLSKDESNATLSRVVREIANDIEGGKTFSEALGRHPRIFNKLYVSMVKAGEGAGTLDRILDQLAIYLEKVDAMRTKIKSAMSYPIFVLIFAILATLVLLLKIVPAFEGIYASFDAELPAPTRAVLFVSHLIQDNIVMVALGSLLAIIGIWLWRRTESGRYHWDHMLLRLPVFGPILKKAVISRFGRTLGILLDSGLPVLDALELVKGATGNEYIAAGISRAKLLVAEGKDLTTAFRQSGVMPEMVLQLMATGEETGSLDQMLIKSSDFYDRQVDAAVSGLTALIEPLLIVFVGVIVGIIVITMFLPIFYLGEAVFRSYYK